jgi:hypothetical protein
LMRLRQGDDLDKDTLKKLKPDEELILRNIALTHNTRIWVNDSIQNLLVQGNKFVMIPPQYRFDKNETEGNFQSQHVKLFVGALLICYSTNFKLKTETFSQINNSDLFEVTDLEDDHFQVKRVLKKAQKDSMSANEIEAAEHERIRLRYNDIGKSVKTADREQIGFSRVFRLGYCITAHSAQGDTIQEKITVWDFNHPNMKPHGRYVACSRVERLSDLTISTRVIKGEDVQKMREQYERLYPVEKEAVPVRRPKVETIVQPQQPKRPKIQVTPQVFNMSEEKLKAREERNRIYEERKQAIKPIEPIAGFKRKIVDPSFSPMSDAKKQERIERNKIYEERKRAFQPIQATHGYKYNWE